MPGTPAVAPLTVSAPTVTIGHVLSTLVVRVRTAFGSIVPMSIQPTAATVTSATPYAASLSLLVVAMKATSPSKLHRC